MGKDHLAGDCLRLIEVSEVVDDPVITADPSTVATARGLVRALTSLISEQQSKVMCLIAGQLIRPK